MHKQKACSKRRGPLRSWCQPGTTTLLQLLTSWHCAATDGVSDSAAPKCSTACPQSVEQFDGEQDSVRLASAHSLAHHKGGSQSVPERHSCCVTSTVPGPCTKDVSGPSLGAAPRQCLVPPPRLLACISEGLEARNERTIHAPRIRYAEHCDNESVHGGVGHGSLDRHAQQVGLHYRSVATVVLP
jgi:hypothetical protein